MATIWFCQIFQGEKDPLTDAATDTRGGYLTAMRMGSIVAEARKHLGMVEQPSKRMFYAILPPFPSTSHSSSFELHALSSQVANLSVIILKAKETWANLYASIRVSIAVVEGRVWQRESWDMAAGPFTWWPDLY